MRAYDNTKIRGYRRGRYDVTLRMSYEEAQKILGDLPSDIEYEEDSRPGLYKLWKALNGKVSRA